MWLTLIIFRPGINTCARVVVVCRLKPQLHLHPCSMWSRCVPDHLRGGYADVITICPSVRLGCIILSCGQALWDLQSNRPKTHFNARCTGCVCLTCDSSTSLFYLRGFGHLSTLLSLRLFVRSVGCSFTIAQISVTLHFFYLTRRFELKVYSQY